MQSFFDAVLSRRSIREFTDAVIPDADVTEIVAAAGRAPSSKNTQPWTVRLIRGAALERLRADFLAAFDAGEAPRPDYAYSPQPLPPEWADRAKACGIGILSHKGITREDKEGRRLHDRANFEFFRAPQVFFVATRAGVGTPGVYMDCGYVLNNLMLGLAAKGWASCPQYSAVSYPDLLRRHLPGTEGLQFLAGLSCGRARQDSIVNGFQPPRLPLGDWFTIVE